MLSLSKIVLIVFIQLWWTENVAQLMPSAWPEAGQNSRQTRQSPYAGPKSADIYWEYQADGQLSSEPVVDQDGTMYFGTSVATVYALSASGQLQWNYSLINSTNSKTNHQILNSPALGKGGSLFVAAMDGFLYCFSLSGKLIYEKNFGSSIIASPVLSDSKDIVYIATFYEFNAVYANSGKVYWSLPYSTAYTPAIGPNNVIYIVDGNQLYAIDATGFVKWHCQVASTSSNIDTSPAVGSDGTVYVADGGFVSAIVDGEVKWSTQVSSEIRTNLIVGSDGNIYAATSGEEFYCISPEGDYVYIFQTGSTSNTFRAPTMDSRLHAFVGTAIGELYSINTNQPVMSSWIFQLGSEPVTAPIITQSSMLVVPAINNKIYAFKPSNCSAGDYISPGASSFCSPCPQGQYSTQENTVDCLKCPYPHTSVFDGQTNCPGILLVPEGSITTLALVLTAMAVVVLVCMYTGKQHVAIFVNLLFPTLDVFSDLAYVTSNEFFNLGLFIACIISIAIPAISFIKTLVERRAAPSLFIKMHESWWLKAGQEHDHIYFPVFPPVLNFHQGRLPFFSSAEHSTFASLILEIIAWVIAIALQILTIVAFIPFNVVFLGFWWIVGVFLHMSKMLTVGNVWNLWFAVWTQSSTHETDVDVDTAELILCLEEEFITETIPQFIIQLTNNLLLQRFTPIAAFSMTFSIVMSINSVWRHVYHRFIRVDAMALEDIPLGMVCHIDIPMWGIDVVLLDATLKNARKKKFVPNTSDGEKSVISEPLLLPEDNKEAVDLKGVVDDEENAQ